MLGMVIHTFHPSTQTQRHVDSEFEATSLHGKTLPNNKYIHTDRQTQRAGKVVAHTQKEWTWEHILIIPALWRLKQED